MSSDQMRQCARARVWSSTNDHLKSNVQKKATSSLPLALKQSNLGLSSNFAPTWTPHFSLIILSTIELQAKSSTYVRRACAWVRACWNPREAWAHFLVECVSFIVSSQKCDRRIWEQLPGSPSQSNWQPRTNPASYTTHSAWSSPSRAV